MAGDGGNDKLLGGHGNDTIRVRGGGNDTIDCGPGRDLVVLDRGDRARGCEKVRREPAAWRTDLLLYDLDADPFELQSLDAQPERRDLADQLAARAASLGSCAGSACY